MWCIPVSGGNVSLPYLHNGSKGSCYVQASCEADLEKAIPLVEQAEAALNTLNKKDFQEAKALNKPPPGVEDITAAVMHLLASVDPIIEARKLRNTYTARFSAARLEPH